MPLIFAGRKTNMQRMSQVARGLGVPGWQAHMATTLQCRETVRWIGQSDLTDDQKRQARATVRRMICVARQGPAHRSRKLGRGVLSAIRPSAQTP